MAHPIAWDKVTPDDVVRALQEYDRLGPQQFFAEHGYAPTTTYDLVWEERTYPPKAILGTAYEFAVGQRLASGAFEGGKAGGGQGPGGAGIERPAPPPGEQPAPGRHISRANPPRHRATPICPMITKG